MQHKSDDFIGVVCADFFSSTQRVRIFESVVNDKELVHPSTTRNRILYYTEMEREAEKERDE